MIRLLNAQGQTKVKQKLTRDEVKFYLGIIIFVMLAIISLGMVNSPMEEYRWSGMGNCNHMDYVE